MQIFKCDIRGATLIAIISAFVLSGCGKSAAETDTQTNKNIPAPARQKIATPAEWNSALDSSYRTSSLQDHGDGTTEYLAVFKRGTGSVDAFVKHDSFQKVWIFTPGIRSGIKLGNYMETHIYAKEGKSPTLFFTPYYFDKRSQLLMNHISIMVNGKIVVDRDLTNPGVKRSRNSWGNEESAILVPTPEDLSELRQISKNSKVLIRLSGANGYVMVNPKDVQDIKDDIPDGIAVYDQLTSALNGHTFD